MQIQEIITYIIIAIASGFVIVSLYRTLFPSKEKLNQHGCAGSCNCDAKLLRKELLIKIKPIENRSPKRNQLPRRKRTGYERPNAQGEKCIAASGGEFNPKDIKN